MQVVGGELRLVPPGVSGVPREISAHEAHNSSMEAHNEGMSAGSAHEAHNCSSEAHNEGMSAGTAREIAAARMNQVYPWRHQGGAFDARGCAFCSLHGDQGVQGRMLFVEGVQGRMLSGEVGVWAHVQCLA
ncbi:hypothetical protein T484DRAFT_1791979 [Baffinella frigidus]|nr:hypothetical protein T484DRAFT_1791979 [Cryptophyta sp. CCMP2293]